MSSMNDTGTIEKIGSQVSAETTSIAENLLPSTSVDPNEAEVVEIVSDIATPVVPPVTVQEQAEQKEIFSPIIGYPPMTNQGHASSVQVQAIVDKAQGLPVVV